jgi:hypothetical protein
VPQLFARVAARLCRAAAERAATLLADEASTAGPAAAAADEAAAAAAEAEADEMAVGPSDEQQDGDAAVHATMQRMHDRRPEMVSSLPSAHHAAALATTVLDACVHLSKAADPEASAEALHALAAATAVLTRVGHKSARPAAVSAWTAAAQRVSSPHAIVVCAAAGALAAAAPGCTEPLLVHHAALAWTAGLGAALRRTLSEKIQPAAVSSARALLAAVAAIAPGLQASVFDVARVCAVGLRAERTHTAAWVVFEALAAVDADSVWAALVRVLDLPPDQRPVGWLYAEELGYEGALRRGPLHPAEVAVLQTLCG